MAPGGAKREKMSMHSVNGCVKFRCADNVKIRATQIPMGMGVFVCAWTASMAGQIYNCKKNVQKPPKKNNSNG